VKTWKLTYNKFNPEEESLKEALCTLGNGYFGTRGAICESAATKVHYPGTYISGVYNTLSTEVAGRNILNEDFVNCPNWLMMNFRIDNDAWFNRSVGKIITWKVELNMRKGILSRRVRWQDTKGRITLIEDHRIVSMAQPHCGAVIYSITPENYNGKITVRSGIDGSVTNAGVERYKQLKSKHLEACSHGTFGEDGIYLQVKTNQSNIKITEAMRTLVFKNSKKIYPKNKVIFYGGKKIFQDSTSKISRGQKYTVEKLVSIYTSRDHGVADECAIAQETVSNIQDFKSLYKSHQAKWQALWKRFDIQIEGNDFIAKALRLHAFHLLQVASTYNEDIDAGMPARGLHGEAYRGHIFWDELYVFPFYNLHAPEITRALLMYRYRRLGAAKEYAQQHNYKGAMFPWQSASTGDEQTQIIHLNPLSGEWGPDYSSLQRHVSLAVAFNVWQYYITSGDRDFLDRYGAEMLLEIACFWSSASTFNEETKRYDIEGVMGPDEFHEKYVGAKKGGNINSTYTNVMAVWVIDKALHLVDKALQEEERNALLFKTGISAEEIDKWRMINKKMTIEMGADGLMHQFKGFMDLKELDWDEYRRKYDNIHRIDRILKAEGLSPDKFKVAKQADVLMLFYVLNFKELSEIFKRLGYPFSRQIMKKNFKYYFPRTSHGSTLSVVVHAYVADFLGFKEKSMEYLVKALESDFYDTQGGTTQEGIHTGVMGSSLDLFLRFFAGLSFQEDCICFAPRLPEKWKKIKFNIRFKNIWFHITILEDKMKMVVEPLEEMSLNSPAEIPVEVNHKRYQLKPKKIHIIQLSPSA